MSLEIIPIGTILAVLTSQVIKTANAATEVAFEKESFKVLAKHLFEIEPVLKELQLQDLNGSQAALTALKSLESDVKKANALVDRYRARSRFYLLLKCRVIVGEVQDVTRDLGRSLASLSLANAEVLSRISDQVDRLQSEMQRVEFETSEAHGRIADRLNNGFLRAHRLDQAFADDVLREIAAAVGVPVEPSEIGRELADFRRAKEEAAARKERAEEFFLTQVIELLSRADAARDFEEVESRYATRVRTMERYGWREEYVLPLRSFLCRVSNRVMVDPVSLSTGTTCERAAVVARFESGDTTDPDSGEPLEDLNLRENVRLRQSIEEWRELKCCLEIRSLKAELSSGVAASVGAALGQIRVLMTENPVVKDWVSIEGLVGILVPILVGDTVDRDLETEILITLKVFVQGHTRNKEAVIESQAWDHIIRCLESESEISSTSIELLYELLQERSGWNVSACRKLSQQPDSVVYLVNLLESSDRELAEKILMKLLDVEDENYSRAARAGWFKPLIDCLLEGPETSRESMVRAIVKLELDDLSLKELGESGVIPVLVEMANGGTESKEQSLSALAKLSCHGGNRRLVAESGGVRLAADLAFSPGARSFIVVKCCEILDKVASGGGSGDNSGDTAAAARLFVDERGEPLDLGAIVTNLLALLQRPNSAHNVRKPALRTLLGICNFGPGLVERAVLAVKDLSLVLHLLDDPDSEIREIAVKLLFLFSNHEQDRIIEHLLKPRRVEALVGFLESEDKDDVRLAAAGLLVNLPRSATRLTETLLACDGHIALVKMLSSGGAMEARETALGALLRFAGPESLESQQALVGAGVYPLAVDFLGVGSTKAKARAAALIGGLSASSQRLTDTSESGFCRCLMPKGVSLCGAHGGVCGVSSSFCLLESNALPGLVKLLREQVNETASEAIAALSTLVNENSPNRGASVLHSADAVKPVLEVLNWGTVPVKEEALGLLEKVFSSKEMVQNYATSARFVLVGLTGGRVLADGRGLTGKAAKILSMLERNSKSSMSFLRGNSGSKSM